MSLRAIRYQCPFHLLCSYVPTTSLSTHTRHNYYWKCMTPTITHNNSTKPLRKEFPVKRPISMSCIGVSIYSQFVLYSLPLCDAPFNSTNDNDLRNRIHACPPVPLATTRTLRSLNSLFTNTFPELDLFLTFASCDSRSYSPNNKTTLSSIAYSYHSVSSLSINQSLCLS